MSTLNETLAKLDSVINHADTDEAVRAALVTARTAAIKSEIIRLQEELKTAKALLPAKELSDKQKALAAKRLAAKEAKAAAKAKK